MLLECGVADAYCIPFEFVPDTEDRPNDLMTFHRHPKYWDMKPGHYTDDTQRSIANALLILSGGENSGAIFEPRAYVQSYQYTFGRDQRAGYSRKFEAFLKQNLINTPQRMMLNVVRKPSNGSVMGAAVLGYLRSTESVMMAAACQALSTHSYETIPYAQIIALSAHYAIYSIGPKAEMQEWLRSLVGPSSETIDEYLAGEFTRPDTVTMAAQSVASVMLWGVPRHDSLRDLIKVAVEIGGDTDSAAAVMVAVASESPEYLNDVPETLVQNLEQGMYGADYLRSLDTQLRALTRAL